MTMSTSLDELASPQSGVIARRQLLAAGWSDAAIDRALSSRRLASVARGVYLVSGAPWSRRAAQHAALLLIGDDALLARWTAAQLHGFADAQAGPVDVCAPQTRRRPVGVDGLVRLTRSRTLPTHERTEREGLPVTSGARTLLDLARTASAARLGELVATAIRVRACTPTGIQRTLEEHPNARGRGRLRAAMELLADDGGSARSVAEIVALRAIVAAGVPRPVVAHRVVDDQGRLIAEVDLAYPQARVAIEIDGFAWHSSPARKRRDEQRQNALVLVGWTVLRFSASEVRDRPHLLVAAVNKALT